MPKRQRSSNTSASGSNPLSDARLFKKDVGSNKAQSADANTDTDTAPGVTIIKNSLANHKADQNAQSLWHRKSGAGYSLFLTYYGSQPDGVVISADGGGGRSGVCSLMGTNVSHKNNCNGVTNSSSVKGMSRAAKRRQKKRAKSDNKHEGELGNSDKKTASVDATTTSNPQKLQLNTSHPLSQAYISQSKLHHPEMQNFVNALSKPLPLTFRLRQHDPSISAKLASILDEDFSNLVAPVSYDPTKAIYQSRPNNDDNENSSSMATLCKSNLGKVSPKLKELIVQESMNGTLARQELGSMLPVLCLSGLGAIRAGSKVLDLCASPGSKTMQALELVAPSHNPRKKVGKVIANDVHTGRLDALQKATARSGLPSELISRITYTSFDASTFPSPKSGKLFDAIICDVPCSGDGTIRKDEHILPNWIPRTGNALHGLQLKILCRALKLVKVGGFICYSTCSLNPVEDEAVVSAALKKSNNALHVDGEEEKKKNRYELVDWPEGLLPGFIRRPGVDSWKVAFYDQNSIEDENDDFGSLKFSENHREALENGMEDAQATLWPNREWNQGLSLEKCIRLFPQDHDSGGFFLALLRRLE